MKQKVILSTKNYNQQYLYLSSGLWLQQNHTGCICGTIPNVVISLREHDSSIKLTPEQESWLTSIMFLLFGPSNIAAGILTRWCGRKCLYFIFVIPNIISVLLLYFANSYSLLISGYVFAGLSGAAGCISSFIISECCSPKLMGTMLDLKYLIAFLGIGTIRVLSNFLNQSTLVLISGIPLLVPIITCLTSPESPAWLASKGRFRECKESFLWYRGDGEMEELNRLVYWQDDVIYKKRSESTKSNPLTFLRDKTFLKATFISIISVVYFDFCGKVSVMYHMDVVNTITKDASNGNYYVFAIDLSDVVALSISTIFVTKFKRRKLLFGLGVPAVILLYVFCGINYLSSINVLPEFLPWLPFAILIAYFFMISVSVLPVCNAVMGEVCPLEHRGKAMIINSVVFGTTTFGVTKLTPACVRYCGISGLFFFFAVISSLGLLSFYYNLPETFNKTLQNIEHELDDKTLEGNSEVNEKMLNKQIEVFVK